ncbi:MAG: hypothetical protein KDD62_06560, partial [Bdellovibrionales bacterium]|nr:hypothetical protein [Bdellovibrionales bacterium]
MRFFVALVILWSFLPGTADAQHAIDVQRLAAEGEYFEALHAYDSMASRRRTLEAQIAAGNAAWALSLPARSIEEFESVLQSDEITEMQRAQLLLSRGIIEFQESRYRVAVLFAERVFKQFDEPNPLRARALLLWGDALMKLESFGLAEEKYHLAVAELPSQEQFDA